MSTDDMVEFLRKLGYQRMGSTQVNLIYVNRQHSSTITVPNLPPGEHLSQFVVRRIMEEADQA